MIREYRLPLPSPPSGEFIPDDVFGAPPTDVESKIEGLRIGALSGARAFTMHTIFKMLRSGELLLTLCVDRADRRWQEIGTHEILTGMTLDEERAVVRGHGVAFGVTFYAARVRHADWLPLGEAVVIYSPDIDQSKEWFCKVAVRHFEIVERRGEDRVPCDPGITYRVVLGSALAPHGEPAFEMQFGDLRRFAVEATSPSVELKSAVTALKEVSADLIPKPNARGRSEAYGELKCRLLAEMPAHLDWRRAEWWKRSLDHAPWLSEYAFEKSILPVLRKENPHVGSRGRPRKHVNSKK